MGGGEVCPVHAVGDCEGLVYGQGVGCAGGVWRVGGSNSEREGGVGVAVFEACLRGSRVAGDGCVGAVQRCGER